MVVPLFYVLRWVRLVFSTVNPHILIRCILRRLARQQIFFMFNTLQMAGRGWRRLVKGKDLKRGRSHAKLFHSP